MYPLLLIMLFLGITNYSITGIAQENTTPLRVLLIEKCKSKTQEINGTSEIIIFPDEIDKYSFYKDDHPSFAPPVKIDEDEIEMYLNKRGQFQIYFDIKLTNQNSCSNKATHSCYIKYKNKKWIVTAITKNQHESACSE